MDQSISATKLYDHCKCPHKVYNDAFVDHSLRDPIGEFTKLLWEKGVTHEENIMKDFPDFLDLSFGSWTQREEKTKQALKNGAEVIYQGVIKYGNLFGIPDLLIKNNDQTYVPVDIKSGRGLEGGDDIEPGVLREHYAMGLAVYLDILNNMGYSNNKMGYIYDVDMDKVLYPLDTPIKMKTRETYWERYLLRKKEIQDIFDGKIKTTPALGGMCKQCPWYSLCKKEILLKDDLTKIFYMGRRDRDIINRDLKISTVKELAKIDIKKVLAIKEAQNIFANDSFLRGIGKTALESYVRRAKVYQSDSQDPEIYSQFDFPEKKYELFFDIEDDPMQDFIYLHGVLERHNGKEKYHAFVAKELNPESEKNAWAEFWNYIKSLPENDFVIYFYGTHEPTAYKRLQEKYPTVVMPHYMEEVFSKKSKKTIDLYSDVICRCTEWPLHSYSVKNIAMFLGFFWRDKNPSGADSIEWFNSYTSSKDQKILDRILEYNEDDCKAMLVIKDRLLKLFSDYAKR